MTVVSHSRDCETFARVSYDSREIFVRASHDSRETFVRVSHDVRVNFNQFYFSQLSLEKVLFMLHICRIVQIPETSLRSSSSSSFIIISILKPLFLYRGLGLFDKSSSKTSSPLRTVHWISKIHSKLLSVIHQHFIPGFLRPARSLLCNYI